ncbi:CBD9-like protein [Mycena venus]|uniref:CBD9-like protein n=1 Tax=Mycena venus TaxID=2733690 RepID=A0A8H7CPS8_9AGAR|nr:CBD9-like protein [Mycena venus]
MVLSFLLCSLFVLVSISSPSHEFNEISKREATGDSICTTYMCIAAVLNGSTVQYNLTSTGKGGAGWMAMGFGTQMANTPIIIMWENPDGYITLSQRQASGEVMPTVDANPPRVATLDTALSTASFNPTFVYTIHADNDTKQSLIYAFATVNPASSAVSAPLAQHLDFGTIQLDLTKSLSSSTPTSSPSPSILTSGPNSTSSTIPKKKLPVGAIAGGVVGGVTVILHRAHRESQSQYHQPWMGRKRRRPPRFLMHRKGGGSYLAVPQGQDAATMADELRTLKEEVQRLKDRAGEGTSTGASATVPTRSLSTMKREQTRVVQDHQQGLGFTDSLIHTDSGLRLTAGRMVDELPPTYAED